MKLSNIFKEKLTESNWQNEHDRLTIQEMKDWCVKLGIAGARVVKEGGEFVISTIADVRIVTSDLHLDGNNMCYIPYQFGEVEGNFFIVGNDREKLSSLKNGPTLVHECYRANNVGLKSLEGLATSISKECDVSNNLLIDWEGIPSQCNHLIIYNNKITSFKGISKNWQIGSFLHCDPICHGVLELLEIEELKQVKFLHALNHDPRSALNSEAITAEKIINHHLNNGRNPIDMQSDFLDADLANWVSK